MKPDPMQAAKDLIAKNPELFKGADYNHALITLGYAFMFFGNKMADWAIDEISEKKTAGVDLAQIDEP